MKQQYLSVVEYTVEMQEKGLQYLSKSVCFQWTKQQNSEIKDK